LGWRHHSILPALRRIVDAIVVPERISGDGDRDCRGRQGGHCRTHCEGGTVSEARIVVAPVPLVLAPGEKTIILQTARVVISICLQLIGLVVAILLQLIRLGRSVLLELARVVLEFGMTLLERVGAVGEGIGIVDAPKSTAAEARITATVEKSSITEART